MSSLGEALRKVEAGTNEYWKQEALKLVKHLAENQKYLDSDIIWDTLDARGVTTPERRAMGPVMIKAVREGWVELQSCTECGTTKVIKPSTRPESHAKDTAVYRSLINE